MRRYTRPVDLHRLAEERSIVFHRAVFEKIAGDARILDRARSRVAKWLARGEPHPFYATQWARVLELPLPELGKALLDRSEEARALRQVTPFAGALPPRERWAIWRDAERRWRHEAT